MEEDVSTHDSQSGLFDQFNVGFIISVIIAILLVVGVIWLLIKYRLFVLSCIAVLCILGYWGYHAFGKMLDGNPESPPDEQPPEERT